MTELFAIALETVLKAILEGKLNLTPDKLPLIKDGLTSILKVTTDPEMVWAEVNRLIAEIAENNLINLNARAGLAPDITGGT